MEGCKSDGRWNYLPGGRQGGREGGRGKVRVEERVEERGKEEGTNTGGDYSMHPIIVDPLSQ